MMGQHTGVQARIKEIVPHLYVQKCLCHSLHLCCSAATQSLPNIIEQFVRDMYEYNYISSSSKRMNEFKEMEIFVQEKPTKLLYPSQTRWLSLRV
jgi:transposase-like protein